MLDTLPFLKKIPFPPLARAQLETLQVNLGYRCNLQCKHCHVNAGPNRTEQMGIKEIEWIIRILETRQISTLDLTGGAPELNTHFQELVIAARKLNVHVIDRCNLVVLEEPEQAELAQFLADQHVEIVASMPCYLQKNVDTQRGKGTFDASIRGLQQLNQLGYGKEDSGKRLNLVFNPQGASLPPAQAALEQDYKKHLFEQYGIVFNRLLTLANMPILRFGSWLHSKGEWDGYMALLQESHQPCNLETVMCRSLVSVDWQGYLYDCDFNQMLGLPMLFGETTSEQAEKTQTKNREERLHLKDLVSEEEGLRQLRDLSGQPITVAGHCYGCTAGQGSSCVGALES